MRITTLSIGIEMRRSNGDYGSDKAEAQLTAALDPGDSAEGVLEQLMGLARTHVEADLGRSPSLTVRRGMITEYRTCNRCGERLDDAERSYMHSACKEAEDAEREARYQQRKAENEARERELVGVAAVDEDEDDEDL